MLMGSGYWTAAVPRQGCQVLKEGSVIGEATSALFHRSLDRVLRLSLSRNH